MVDLDDVDFKKVKRLCMGYVEKYKLVGFIILKSSSGNYHVVFDRILENWSEAVNVIARIAIMSGNHKTWKWV